MHYPIKRAVMHFGKGAIIGAIISLAVVALSYAGAIIACGLTTTCTF
jgi:hypothetical protein